MKRYYFIFLFSLLATHLSAQKEYTIETVPDPKATGTGYVSDPGDILQAGDEATINQLIAELEDSTTAQVAVVVLPSIGQENPKDFTTRLFERWGIGQAGVDNGLLILTVMDQRRTEFETGYGLEAVLPDAVCYRIAMQELVPHFQQGQYGAGLIAALRRIRLTLEQPEAVQEIYATPERKPENGWPYILGGYGLLALLVHIGLLGWIWHALRSKEDLYDRYMSLRKAESIGWLIFFPVPYILIYLFLRRRLRDLRDQPRYSKVNGKPMRKLGEQEDDAYLEQGQITEEEIGSVDYDVWVTEDSDDILVLRYAKRFSKYRQCPKCEFRTYYHASTQTVVPATTHSTGRQTIIHQCKNCGYQKVENRVIPKKGTSSGASGSSSRGSSSWGGGRSGGGGAGVSW